MNFDKCSSRPDKRGLAFDLWNPHEWQQFKFTRLNVRFWEDSAMTPSTLPHAQPQIVKAMMALIEKH
jgi:hypothetical protein